MREYAFAAVVGLLVLLRKAVSMQLEQATPYGPAAYRAELIRRNHELFETWPPAKPVSSSDAWGYKRRDELTSGSDFVSITLTEGVDSPVDAAVFALVDPAYQGETAPSVL